MRWIEACLASIPEKYNVIIVDNLSSDDTCAFITNKYPQHVLLKQNKNLGFGRANNLGIQYALNNNADGVFLLNQDAYLQEHTINKLLEVATQNKDIGILSPAHLTSSSGKLDAGFSLYISNNYCPAFYIDAINNRLKKFYEIPFVNAAGWLLMKKTLLKIGGFDPIFFHYGEDNNYCSRVLFHSLKIVFVPNAHMIHDREYRDAVIKDFSNPSYLKRYESIFKSKHANLIEKKQLKKIKWFNVLFMKLLKLEFRSAMGIIQIIKKEKIWLEQCAESKKINSKEFHHYLKLDV